MLDLSKIDPAQAKAALASYVKASQEGPLTSMHALIYGDKGVGKTRLFHTCPKPILLDMFDPGGEQVVKEDVDSGDIIVRRWADWASYEAEFEVLRQGGVNLVLNGKKVLVPLSLFATYGLDSLTTQSEYLTAWALDFGIRNYKNPKEPHGPWMEMRDWGTVLSKMSYLMRALNLFPLHTICLGHVKKTEDDNTKKVIYTLMIQGSSDQRVPIYLSEVYVMSAAPVCEANAKFKCADGIARWLLVKQEGEYPASTRVGGVNNAGESRFNKLEPANIHALLKKAGMNSEDKPRLLG